MAYVKPEIKNHPPLYYDRAGNPIKDVLEFAKLFTIPGYERVEKTTLSDGTWILTVWLGIDHGLGMGAIKPIIFETMVSASAQDAHVLDSNRYSTEEEARLGHKRMVLKWIRKIERNRIK